MLTEKQHALINGIAYAAAAALLCDGIDIDADKVAAATTACSPTARRASPTKKQLERYTNIMLTLGTAKGILLAEGALHKAASAPMPPRKRPTSRRTSSGNSWRGHGTR